MQYRLDSTLDVDWASRMISRLLEADVHVRGVAQEPSGYSGGAFRFVVRTESGARTDLLLKRVPDANVFRFHEDVLAPFALNSPRMLGAFHRENENYNEHYVVMEYIPHAEPDWGDFERYRRAVDWLARRDALLERHLDSVASLDYIEPFALPALEPILDRARRAARAGLDPLISDSLVHSLEDANEWIRRAGRWLFHGPQTVTHNDFQMLNILFATGDRAGELYVVDWTYPAIGSVCIDLATIVHVAPPEFRRKLIHRYLAARPVTDFPSIFAAAQAHVHLSILEWMIDAMESGQRHAIHRPKLREIVEHFLLDVRERLVAP